MSEKYITELKITETDVKTETDKYVLKSYKAEIEKQLIDLKTVVQAKKSLGEFTNAYHKQKVCQYFLSLIAQRQGELNDILRQSKEQRSIQEDKEIILELKKHVSKEIFLDIVRRVKDKLNGL